MRHHLKRHRINIRQELKSQQAQTVFTHEEIVQRPPARYRKPEAPARAPARTTRIGMAQRPGRPYDSPCFGGY